MNVPVSGQFVLLPYFIFIFSSDFEVDRGQYESDDSASYDVESQATGCGIHKIESKYGNGLVRLPQCWNVHTAACPQDHYGYYNLDTKDSGTILIADSCPKFGVNLAAGSWFGPPEERDLDPNPRSPYV